MNKNKSDQTLNLLDKLATQARKCALIQQEWQPKTEVESLARDRYFAWRRILSSIATTEGYESIVLEPMIKTSLAPELKSYIRSHADDEDRHSKLLKSYLLKNFHYKKRKPTVSDIIFYKNLIPLGQKAFRYFPVVGLNILELYERFAVRLYQAILPHAVNDNLTTLEKLVTLILHDEKRHLIGVVNAKQYMGRSQSIWIRGFENILSAIFLRLARWDLNFSWVGLHNTDLKRHFELLGLDCKTVNQYAKDAFKAVKNGNAEKSSTNIEESLSTTTTF